MNHPAHRELTRRLLARLGGGVPSDVPIGEIRTAEYLEEARCALEQRAIFGRFPVLAAVEGELAECGACVTVEVAGVPLILVRGDDGLIRVFRNACRHRATQLVDAEEPCKKKAIVCPYHGWTYDLTGRLSHVPHREAFDGSLRGRDHLVTAHAATRHGFVWVSLEPFDLADHLGPIDGELAAMGANRWTLHARSVREVRGNWKLIISAFLEAYHIRRLHRDTVYRFFQDAQAEAEVAGPHIRAITARRQLVGTHPDDLASVPDLRQLVTPSYLVFPNTILVLHPDYLSVIGCFPLAAARTRFIHWMLIPEPPRSKAEAEHWKKSFALVDQDVFEKEDLFAVEAMQRGLQACADETVLFGKHEYAALWFHQHLAATLEGAGARNTVSAARTD